MAHVEIDWGTAQVIDGRLTVAFAQRPSPQWRGHAKAALVALSHAGQAWGDVAVKKARVVVDAVAQGTEADVHHYLESIVLQANAHEPVIAEPDADSPDARMTAAFQAFA
jgi:hypothetical protein